MTLLTSQPIPLTPDDRAHVESLRDSLMDVCALLGELNETGCSNPIDAALSVLIRPDGTFDPLGRETRLPRILWQMRTGQYESEDTEDSKPEGDNAEAITAELEAALMADGCGGKGGVLR